MLIIFNIVIHFPNCFSHLLSLVKIKEGKNGFDTFVTIWICSHNKDASKCRSEAISGKCIHQKQAGEKPHGLLSLIPAAWKTFSRLFTADQHSVLELTAFFSALT